MNAMREKSLAIHALILSPGDVQGLVMFKGGDVQGLVMFKGGDVQG